jgi:undecaprenyl diphosphate synthase
MQSTCCQEVKRLLHVAIIMDGNGRWATARRQPRVAGHQAGVAALRGILEAAPQLGITTLSAYAFSTENWRRPAVEVSSLMGLLRGYLQNEVARLVDAGIRLTVLGRRDRVPDDIADLISHAEMATLGGGSLDLRLAIDYSGRDAILEAVAAITPGGATRAEISRQLNERGGGPDIDLLIRTSGEQRLSDFMLWEAAYAELYFTETLWPDFDRSELERALDTFWTRNRRYGGLSADPTAISGPPSNPLASSGVRWRSLGSQIGTFVAGSPR